MVIHIAYFVDMEQTRDVLGCNCSLTVMSSCVLGSPWPSSVVLVNNLLFVISPPDVPCSSIKKTIGLSLNWMQS